MAERDMTPDEREEFEREKIHNEDHAEAGPASENDKPDKTQNPTTVPVTVGPTD